jgi:hypothetical protein
MRLVDRNDIENWAERVDSKASLPILISRLIRATTPFSTQVDFPSGSAAFIGGWDGVAISEEGRGFVPKGTSLWELGTEANTKGKADEDYAKRTADPLGHNKKECTFIFLTPRFWKQKDKWIKEKNKEGVWKEVRVYDSSNIEQWLDNAAAVSRWFSSYISKYPSDGIITIEEYWKEWALCDKGELPATGVTAGREKESEQLMTFLSGPPGIQAIQATSKDEAIAFIIASAKQFEEHHKEIFFSKSLVINSPSNFRSIRINTSNFNLIARFEEPQILFAAAAEGHHVLLPLGPDDTSNQKIITLPTIDRDGQIKSLIDMGFGREDAEKYSRESGRNITILKKLLGFPENKANWLKTESIREIIPALLVGRWNEKSKGDIEIIERFAGVKYHEYSTILQKWKSLEESPLLQIGETWRLTSPLDAWANLSSFITKNDLEVLRGCFMFALQNGNPIVELDENASEMAKYFTKEKTFSTWVREGLIQSLILIGQYGERFKISGLSHPQAWVDNIINELLFEADENLWVSLNHEMPLIAEASPVSFLEATSHSLSQETMPIMAMFTEEQGIIAPTSNHTGLLWALESLSWMPDYLYNASLTLLKLTTLDPGGKLSNRPLNSLTEIFKPWHYQTLADFEQRTDVLNKIVTIEKESGWKLLIRLLPDGHGGIAHPTHKMRWRMFEIKANINYTYQEVWDTHSFIVHLLIDIFDNSEEKFAQLIKESENKELGFKDKTKILEFAEAEYLKVNHKGLITWHKLRKILSHHRSHPDSDWSLTEDELKRYEDLYNKLTPEDTIDKYLWLFDNQWPEFPEGNRRSKNDFEKNQDQQQKKIDEARIIGLTQIIQQFDVEKVKELSNMVKVPWALGDTLAKIVSDDEKILSLAEFLNNEKDKLAFIHSFIYRKTLLNDISWAISLYKKLKEKKFNNHALAQIFVPLYQSKELWDFIDSTNEEVKKNYWLTVYPHFYNVSTEEKILGLKYLIEYNRFFTAIDIGAHFVDEIPTEIIVELLEKAATQKSEENIRFDGYEIGQFFETLDKRSDVNHNTLIQLEWFFLPILDSYSTSRSPKILHDELSKNPAFFVDILKWVFVPKDTDLLEKERVGVSNEIIQSRATQGYRLLHSWKKIPGMNEDGTIDEVFLEYWTHTARALAEEVGRLEVADMQIGQVLAQYPEKDLNWPPDSICSIIESINTKSIKNNFSTALFNKRGSSTRGVFEGGNIERGHAEYFKKLAEKHKIKFPIVSEIFSHLAKNYLADAKRQDESAERDKLEY